MPEMTRDNVEAITMANSGGWTETEWFGCKIPDLAEHFRDPNEWHPKGCWALDLILGKS